MEAKPHLAFAAVMTVGLSAGALRAADPGFEWACEGGVENGMPSDIAVDGAGNCYVTGYIKTGSTFFGPAFVAKYGRAGALEWVRAAGPGTTGMTAHSCLDVDNEGNCYIAGEFRKSVPFTGEGRNSERRDGVYVVKLNADGALQWAQTGGGDGNNRALDVAVDSDGNCLTVTDFGEGDSGIHRGKRRRRGFGASCHGSGAC